nr:MAG TPA: hypothetical protein [Caudoviricetes sp.]
MYQFFYVFSSAMNQSINKSHDTHAIATDGIGYTIPPFCQVDSGRANPISTQEKQKRCLIYSLHVNINSV